MTDNYITVSQAAKLSPGRPHTASVWRWMRRGVRTRSGGVVKLEHVRAGGKLYTTKAALQRFFQAVAESDCRALQPAARFAHTKATHQPGAPTVHRAG